jgi:hypothetical protein
VQNLLEFFQGTVERYPPIITKVTRPVVAYHGTAGNYAKAIVESGTFFTGVGRVGEGVYFFEGGNSAICAAARWAERKMQYDEEATDGAAVVQAQIRVEGILDLDLPDNYEFVERMLRRIKKYVITNCPRDTFKNHAHFIGVIAQECLGHVKILDSVGAVRTRFAYDDNGSAEKGLVVYNSAAIFRPSLVPRLASC